MELWAGNPEKDTPQRTQKEHWRDFGLQNFVRPADPELSIKFACPYGSNHKPSLDPSTATIDIVLLAIASGSFGEGIDLPGNMLNGVIVVGIPLQRPDLETKALNVTYVVSTIDNHKYLVRNEPDKLEAANLLATMKERLSRLVNYTKDYKEKEQDWPD